jgi:hypothetical protein
MHEPDFIDPISTADVATVETKPTVSAFTFELDGALREAASGW